MTYSLEFELPGLPHSNPSDNRHWRKRNREKKDWQASVAVALVGKKPKEPLPFARVTFTRCSSMPPDSDNLGYSFKYIRDSLVLYGVLEDDDPKHLEAKYDWEKAPPKHGKVRVRVKETKCED